MAVDLAAKQAQRDLDSKKSKEQKEAQLEVASKKRDTSAPTTQVSGGKGGSMGGGKLTKELPAKTKKVAVVDVTEDGGGSSSAPIWKKAKVAVSVKQEKSTTVSPPGSRSSSPKHPRDRHAGKSKGQAKDITRLLEASAQTGGRDSAFARQSLAHAQVYRSVCGLFGRLQSGLCQVRDAEMKLDYVHPQVCNARSGFCLSSTAPSIRIVRLWSPSLIRCVYSSESFGFFCTVSPSRSSCGPLAVSLKCGMRHVLRDYTSV